MKRHDESISDRLRRLAATDELTVGRGRAEQIAARALARVEARPRQRARLVAAIVSGSAFAIVSVTGVGAIADQAVPGDSLYPVDRAYESIGRVIGRDTDRTQERLEEALALVQRGDRVAAANHVNTELSQRILVIESPGEAVEDEQAASTALVADADSADDQAVVAAAESSPATTAATAPPSAEAAPVEDDSTEASVDPFLLALENALRATQAAVDTDDELVAAEADEALRSVVKLAAGATEDALGTSPEVQAAPGAVLVQTTTTTTPTTTTVARQNNGNGQGNNTSTTTTTSVPSDPLEEPPGDGETAGDDSGGSQEGSGSAGEPGEDGDESPGPLILPIP